MKSTVALMAGVALAAGSAAAAQQQETQAYDPDRTIITDDEAEDRTGMSDPSDVGDYDTQAQSQPTESYSSQTETATDRPSTYGPEPATSITEMRSAELVGRPVVLDDGGLIGNIQEVGYSEKHQSRVATVDVGGFVGFGSKVIAIPLDDLTVDRNENLTAPVTREWIETEDAFDPANLTFDQ